MVRQSIRGQEDVMTNREFLIARRKAERKAFVNVLKALPQDRLDYQPEPKARNARDLAWVIVAEEADLAKLLETGAMEWKPEKAPATVAEMVATYETRAAGVDEQLGKLDEAGWEKTAKFLLEGKVAWEDTLGNMVWGFLFDAIHHRGQLSTYLRPMGSKVPSIYGPSADDPGEQ
jgi:uncharacterized damage-inducible protein DinB